MAMPEVLQTDSPEFVLGVNLFAAVTSDNERNRPELGVRWAENQVLEPAAEERWVSRGSRGAMDDLVCAFWLN